MAELAVVGTDRFTLGFKIAGVRKTISARDPAPLAEAVEVALEDPKVGVLVMETEDLERLEPALRRRLEASIRPTLVAIGTREDVALREKIKQALGVDVWR